MSTLAIWCRVVQSRDVSLHNFDGLAMSGLAFSVAPSVIRRFKEFVVQQQGGHIEQLM